MVTNETCSNNIITPSSPGYAASGGSSAESASTLSVLANRVAAVIPHQWRNMAVQLELTEGDIKAIQEDENTVSDRFNAVMKRWKQSLTKPFTWEALINALRSPSVNELRLANELTHDFVDTNVKGAKA